MKLFIFGAGYTARHFTRLESRRFSRISATVRSSEKAAFLTGEGIDGLVFNEQEHDERILEKLADSDAVLVTSQPISDGDQVLRIFGEALNQAASPSSILARRRSNGFRAGNTVAAGLSCGVVIGVRSATPRK